MNELGMTTSQVVFVLVVMSLAFIVGYSIGFNSGKEDGYRAGYRRAKAMHVKRGE